MTRDPARFDMFVERETAELVVDGRRFDLDPEFVDRAEGLIALAVSMAAPDTDLSSPSGDQRSHPGASSDNVSEILSSLVSWAGALILIASVLGIMGVAGGLILAIQSEDRGLGQIDYPYVAAGIGIAANAAFFAVLGVVVGKLPKRTQPLIVVAEPFASR
jgi:hypothetical protein